MRKAEAAYHRKDSSQFANTTDIYGNPRDTQLELPF